MSSVCWIESGSRVYVWLLRKRGRWLELEVVNKCPFIKL